MLSSVVGHQKGKGDDFSQEAEVVYNNDDSKSLWSTTREKKCEDASALFDKAGDAYKVGGFYYDAAAAYMRSATILRDDLKNNFDASKAFKNAATNFKKADSQKAMKAYNTAIVLMNDSGRVLQAAKLCKECAIYENEELIDNKEEKLNTVN
eukprot:CAMPEP_0194136728 /NCGR_PEP_ID=MMETSP0152-20130528/6734_1 /TAXON_ID=1049557 /ORGANISM="Thalassiothrix antarctica, Strain L6-D1" /LENGTH=151 /DNA_ID=CAMNT_0038833505 /DNA_START=95 /DNA_END=550 /DNA_ORIENTATION=+